MYDLAIIGGGPAGVAAGVYAARKLLKTVLIAEEIGGQSTVSVGVENWIGTVKISGPDLATALETHLKAYADNILDIKTGLRAESVTTNAEGFEVKTSDGQTYRAKAVLVATGSSRRKLEIAGAAEFENKGITYCASCDGPLFAGQDVAVIGGGNAAFETAAQLLAYAKSVTLLNRGDSFKADARTVKTVLAYPNMKAITNVDLKEVRGERFVQGITYTDIASGEERILPVTGIFVEIGLIPSTGFLGDLVERNSYGQIVTDPRTQRASRSGIWAAGDCTDTLYHQNNIAAGDAVRALEDIYLALRA